MNYSWFNKEPGEVPADVPYINLLASSLTTDVVDVKTISASGVSNMYAVETGELSADVVKTVTIGSIPKKYEQLQYSVCERSLDITPYPIPIPAQNVFGSFKGSITGFGSTPQNYGQFVIEYTLTITNTAVNNLISIYTEFGSSGIGQTDIIMPVGTSLVEYKLCFTQTGGTSSTADVLFYSTVQVYGTTLTADFNEGGAVTLNGLTNQVRPTFYIRSDKLPANWSAVRRKYIYYKI